MRLSFPQCLDTFFPSIMCHCCPFLFCAILTVRHYVSVFLPDVFFHPVITGWILTSAYYVRIQSSKQSISQWTFISSHNVLLGPHTWSQVGPGVNAQMHNGKKTIRSGYPGRRWIQAFFTGASIASTAAAVVMAELPVRYSTTEAAKTTCSDFADGHFAGLSWTFDDCIEVWTAFRDNLSRGLVIRPPHVDLWKTTAAELRRAGKPCMLASFLNSYSNAHGVGIGSTTMKHFATWILAEETGCDWVTPSWTSFNATRKNETATYCHSVADKTTRGASSTVLDRPCVSVNWLAYFNFGVPSVDLPEGITLKSVTVSWRVAFGLTAVYITDSK